MLVRNHRAVRIEIPDDDAYQFKSMKERHPRSAVGWNREHYFLVTVDGRQKESVGMTLEELGKHLAAIGCSEAMNLDGGGSATLWADGRIRNHPSDGSERPIANALVVVRPENPAP
jgi:exopolysaccharide biosynthesis protein